jgi:hypothetical protein
MNLWPQGTIKTTLKFWHSDTKNNQVKSQFLLKEQCCVIERTLDWESKDKTPSSFLLTIAQEYYTSQSVSAKQPQSVRTVACWTRLMFWAVQWLHWWQTPSVTCVLSWKKVSMGSTDWPPTTCVRTWCGCIRTHRLFLVLEGQVRLHSEFLPWYALPVLPCSPISAFLRSHFSSLPHSKML